MVSTTDKANSPKRFGFSKLAKGTIWASVDNWGQQLLQIITFINIGNVIGPTATGTMLLAFLYGNLVYALVVNSYTEVVVQRQDLDEDHKTAAFWTIVGLGLSAGLVSLVAAYGIGAIFNAPAVVPVIQVLSATFCLYGPISFYQALIRREMRFHVLAIRTVLAVGTGAAVAIYLAHKGFGLWSLVIFHLIWRFTEAIVLIVACQWLPRLRFSKKHFGDLANFGGNSLLLNLLFYVNATADRYVIVGFLGEAALGIYGMSRRFVDSLTFGLTGVFTNVAMSVFSRLQNDRVALRKTVVSATQISNLIGFPTFAGLAVVAEPLVYAFLKEDWVPMIPVLRILCLAGALSSITYFMAASVKSVGRADISVRITLITLVIRVSGVLAAVHWGINAVASVNVLAIVIVLIIQSLVVGRLIGLDLKTFATSLLPATWSCIVMVVLTYFGMELIEHRVSPQIQLLLIVPLGIVSYVGTIVLTSPRSLKLVISAFRSKKLDSLT